VLFGEGNGTSLLGAYSAQMGTDLVERFPTRLRSVAVENGTAVQDVAFTWPEQGTAHAVSL